MVTSYTISFLLVHSMDYIGSFMYRFNFVIKLAQFLVSPECLTHTAYGSAFDFTFQFTRIQHVGPQNAGKADFCTK